MHRRTTISSIALVAGVLGVAAAPAAAQDSTTVSCTAQGLVQPLTPAACTTEVLDCPPRSTCRYETRADFSTALNGRIDGQASTRAVVPGDDYNAGYESSATGRCSGTAGRCAVFVAPVLVYPFSVPATSQATCASTGFNLLVSVTCTLKRRILS